MNIRIIFSKKGISPIIAIVLLLMMTIAIGGLAYTFIQRFQTNLETTAENQSSENIKTFKANVKIDGYNTSCSGNDSTPWLSIRVAVRNAGTQPVTNAQLIVDDQLIQGASNATLGAGVATSYLLTTGQGGSGGNQTCSKWINQTKKLGLSFDQGAVERSFTISCTTGSC